MGNPGLYIWGRWRTALTRWVAVGGLAAVLLLIGLQMWVVTDAERLRHKCERMAAAVVDGDVEALGAELPESFGVPIEERWT